MTDPDAPCMMCYPVYCPQSVHISGVWEDACGSHGCPGFTEADWDWEGEGPPLYGCEEK